MDAASLVVNNHKYVEHFPDHQPMETAQIQQHCIALKNKTGSIGVAIVLCIGQVGRYDGGTMGDGRDTNRIRGCSQDCAGKVFPLFGKIFTKIFRDATF